MSEKNQHHRLIILGSGPAGLTAAIYSARAILNPVVVSGREAGGQLMITTDVENYPGFPEGIKGPEMMELLKEQALRFGTKFLSGDVIEVDLRQRPFKLNLENKDTLTCDSLIISSGASAPEKLVQDFISKIKTHSKVKIEEVEIVKENVTFKLPNSLN